MNSAVEKRVLPVPSPWSDASRSLAVLYVLASDERAELGAYPPSQAVWELVRHTYTLPLMEAADHTRHLAACSALAARVPVRRLARPRDLARIGECMRLVEADLDASG